MIRTLQDLEMETESVNKTQNEETLKIKNKQTRNSKKNYRGKLHEQNIRAGEFTLVKMLNLKIS